MHLQHICNVNERQHTITSYGDLLREKDVAFPYVFHFRGFTLSVLWITFHRCATLIYKSAVCEHKNSGNSETAGRVQLPYAADE